MRSKLSTQPLLAPGSHTLFCLVFLWYLPRIYRWLSTSYLFWGSEPFLVLWLERTSFCVDFFQCSLKFLGCWIFSSKSGYLRQKKTQETHYLISWISRSQDSLPSSLHFSKSSLFYNNVQGFYFISGRNKELYIFSDFKKYIFCM